MNFRLALILLLFPFVVMQSQITSKDSIKLSEKELDEADILLDTIYLDDVIVGKHNLPYADVKEYLLLKNRVYKVYPFAKIASERLTLLDKNMAKLKTKKEKKKYFKIVEDYIENEFTDRLKKLSRKQGQILVKLVYRQTGQNVYSLIKDHKSGIKAFMYDKTGKLFDIDIKRGYNPEMVNEDYLIETILEEAFINGRLVRQKPAVDVDLDELDDIWLKKAEAQAKK